MRVSINNENFEVIIIKKKIKNTYIRVKSDLKIYVSTNVFASEKYILDLIYNNEKSVLNMIDREKRKLEKSKKFFYLGNDYNIILCNEFKNPLIKDGYVYVSSLKKLDDFLIKEAKRILPERLLLCYEKMNKCVPWPRLVIRKMVRKWGYCNKRDKLVTLNRDLVKYGYDEIDYVIVHELCHFIHFDHSKAFWETVKYYKPNYKENRKVLREE